MGKKCLKWVNVVPSYVCKATCIRPADLSSILDMQMKDVCNTFRMQAYTFNKGCYRKESKDFVTQYLMFRMKIITRT